MNNFDEDKVVSNFVSEAENAENAEFHFVWIDSYHCYEKQPFNLSGRYICEINKDATCLTIKDNPRYINGLWGQKNIRNVTALVGQNGAGKSSFLEFMLDTFPQFSEVPKPKDRKLIAAIERDGKFSVVFNHVSAGCFTVNDLTSGKLWQDSVRFFEPDFKTGSVFAGRFHDLEFITYSSEFNAGHFRKSDVGKGHADKIHDLSTRYLVQNDAEAFSNRHSSLPQLLTAHTSMETLRNVDFLLRCEKAEKLLGFVLPKTLGFNPVQYSEAELKEILGDDYQKFGLSTRGVGKDRFLDEFALAALFNFLKDTSSSGAINMCRKAMKGGQATTFDKIVHFFRLANVGFGGPAVQLRADLLEYCGQLPNAYFELVGNFMTFDVHRKVAGQRLKKFYDMYNSSIIFTPYVNELWDRPVSSGQQSLWNLYSRFWCFRKGRPSNQNDRDVKGPKIVLLDEADQYFHPMLQKELVDRLLVFLAGTVFSKSSVQIILTSNSPFCLSDIPRDHMILLKADKNGKCKVVPRTDIASETLGASIPDLLAEEFFMGYSTMGDFARKRIQSLIRWLNKRGKKSSLDAWLDATVAWRLIESVGEPLLQKKLMALYGEVALQRDDTKMKEMFSTRASGERRAP